MYLSILFLLSFLTLPIFTAAQFEFFQDMFGQQADGGGGHPQQRQNMPSDSRWYQENWANGTLRCSLEFAVPQRYTERGFEAREALC